MEISKIIRFWDIIQESIDKVKADIQANGCTLSNTEYAYLILEDVDCIQAIMRDSIDKSI